ncbi:hypothetical protein PACTADRAFT_32091 [Pachysolen tannophilus NRRL Y-2460]|uniref:Nuclear pore complex protein n=1 Tax=Pachysolen tannophilus NRRL Y-2460 TaxID=669874 RepID=A0A1E4TXW9_PACTA|nr:hypothetical protein PACTADRAFT_32091 [Pachysolen tannophilus NRRL Y-2460]
MSTVDVSELKKIRRDNVENLVVLDEFAKCLKKFKLDPEAMDPFEMISSFKIISAKDIVSREDLEDADNLKKLSRPDKIKSESGCLEVKFWSLVEALVGFRYSQDYSDIDEDSNLKYLDKVKSTRSCHSEFVLKEHIVVKDNLLQEITIIKNWLVDNFGLDEDDEDVEDEIEMEIELEKITSSTDDPISNGDGAVRVTKYGLASSKWLHTRVDLQSSTNKPDLVSNLDIDAPLRNNLRNSKRLKKINQKDAIDDYKFHKLVFKLLLENKIEKIIKLCKHTNNWTLLLILSGIQDYVDPEIDIDFVLEGGIDNSSENLHPSTPFGIKNSLLWRRTVFSLSQNKNLDKYERGIYGFLSGNYEASNDLDISWERKLLICLQALYLDRLEKKVIYVLGDEVDEDILNMPIPEISFESISDILDNLSKNSNNKIVAQSKNSIRMLIGSILKNKIESLLENSVRLFDDLFTLNNNYRNDATVTEVDSENLIIESYLLRILVHFTIFMKILDDSIVDNENLIKLIKYYVNRLSLLNQYTLIPIYLSFIPYEKQIVENYAFILCQLTFERQDRLKQLEAMRLLKLPLEDILKRTVQKAFEDNKEYYDCTTNENILISDDENSYTEIDQNIFDSLHWLLEANMHKECLSSILVLARKLLLKGKIFSLMKFWGRIHLVKLVNKYKFDEDLLLDYQNKKGVYDMDKDLISAENIQELFQYEILIKNFKLLRSYTSTDQKNFSTMDSIKSLNNLSVSFKDFIKSWLFELSSSSSIPQADLQVLNRLRLLYIPYFITKYFDIVSSGEKNSQEQNLELIKINVIELVEIMSSDDFKIYDLFSKTNRLKSFLKMFGKFNAEIFDNSENGIYD